MGTYISLANIVTGSCNSAVIPFDLRKKGFDLIKQFLLAKCRHGSRIENVLQKLEFTPAVIDALKSAMEHNAWRLSRMHFYVPTKTIPYGSAVYEAKANYVDEIARLKSVIVNVCLSKHVVFLSSPKCL